MNNLTKTENDLPLEECLLDLARYGEPLIKKFSEGWWASVYINENNINHESSDLLGSPTAAANQCRSRIIEYLAKIKNGSFEGGRVDNEKNEDVRQLR